MQTQHPFACENNVSLFSKLQKLSYLKLACLAIASLLLPAANTLFAQTSTCTGATSLTVVNAASCSPGTTFNISSNNTSVLAPYSSCATGVTNPGNGWGQFVANSSTASISYTNTNRDAMIFAYTGTCGLLLTQIGCVNAVSGTGTETLNLSGLTAGDTYYVRIVRYNSTGNMNGTICVASPGTITTGSISGSPFCAGATLSVPFTSTGAYTSNTYTAQLSNSAGSFASPTSIGTLVSNSNSGTITATIPAGTATGSGYRIRVISNGPSVTGSDNGANLTINAAPTISGTLTVCTGATTTLTGSGTPAASNPWVSATTSVATVNSSGVVTGVAAGTSVITYTNNIGCSRTATVTVSTATITGTLSTCVGSTTTLTGSGAPAASNPWVSATTSVATVNSSGVVSGVSAGTSVITYTNNVGCSATATVTANAQPTITGTLSVCAGSTTTLTGSGTPAASNPWVSATTSVATVNSSGVVTGIAAGTSVITYTNNMGCSRTATVTVNTATITGTLTTCVGSTTTLTGSGTPAASNPWLSATTSVATVNSSGVVSGVSAGTSLITYTNTTGCSSTATVTVNALPTISGTLTVCAGATTTLTGSGTPAASTPWVSATTSVATVNSSGVVTGVSGGTSIITFTNNLGCSRTATVTVNALPVISGTLSVCAGLTTTLTGSGTPAASNPWVSATPSVATVNSSGVVTGVAAGTSIVTYTNNTGCSTTATVTVSASLGIVTITPSSASTCNNSIVTLTATNYVNTSSPTNSSGAISVSIPDNSAAGATSTIAVSGIPSDATVTGVSVNFNITHTYDGDLILNIKAPNNNVLNLVNRRGGSGNNFTNTIINSTSATAVSSGSAPFSGTYAPDAASGVGATSNVSNVTSFSSLYSTPNGNWVFSARDASNFDPGTITSWSVTITYTVPAITWQTNTTELYTDAAATVPYVAQKTATVYAKPATTQTYTATATAANGCTSSNTATVTVTAPPTITAASTAAAVCFSSNAQNSTLAYSATTGSPTLYSITWDAAALSAGLVNLANTAITSSPLNVPIAANTTAGTYNGSITVTNAGCTGGSSSFTVTINSLPTITTPATALSKCFSSSFQNGLLSYSATTGSPTHYTITWDAAAQAAGLNNLGSTSLAGSPLFYPIAAGTTGGIHNGTLTVTDALGCSSTGNAFTQEIADFPTITISATAATKCFNSSAQTSTLGYSATTNSPTLYRIIWDAAALSAGLVNSALASLPASQMSVSVAGGVTAGTYNGSVKVMNAAGCESASGFPFTLTIINAAPPVMTSASSATICSGGTVNIPLTSNIAATYTWIAADNALTTGESTTLQTSSTLNNTIINTVSTARSVIYSVRPTAGGGCEGAAQTVTVTVNPEPTITASATAAARCYNTSAQTSTLSYSATTASPATYNIVWNAAALSAGLVNTGNIPLPGSPMTFSIPAGVAAGTYTGTLTVKTSAGCSSSGHSFTVTINPGPSISTQPVSQNVCSGTSVSLSVAAIGTSLTYQWRKGTSNICNCGSYSGATTATLTINPIATGDAATNYNCVVSSAGCSSVISDFATLTVTPGATAPAALPKDLVFPTVSTTSVLGSFTPSGDATNYLVIRKTTNVAPTNPSDGTAYPLNSTTLTGTVDYVGTSLSFTSNGLTPGTTYYYWVFPYNTSTCGTSPLYLTTTPLTGSVTTATNIACGTVTTLYWGGTGSGLPGAVSGTDFNTASNWSTSSSSYVASPAAPTQCNNVSLALTSSATILLSGTAEIYGLTFTVSGNNRVAKLSTQGNTLTVNSDAVIDVLSGNGNTAIYIGENSNSAGIVDFKANFKIGETYFANSVPQSYLSGNINSKITFRGDVLFGRTAAFLLPGQTVPNAGYPPTYPIAAPGAATTPGTIEFDGPGLQQVLWNNDRWYDCFYNIVVGNQNKPYVRHVTGTYTPDNILNDLTINDGCTVDLASSQWIREQSGGTLTMNGSAKLILGNYRSIQSSQNTGVTIAGSNFPGGFSTMNISSSSTIEYNGGSNMTQTVYATPTYGNLILSNTNNTGNAPKISTGIVTISGTATISDKTTFTPGANITVDGTMDVNSGGTLVCGTQVVSGSGTFNLLSGGNITMASTSGITSSGATGNIQTSARSFSTGGNYTYNASTAQATGNGLPTTVNNLTISNAAGVSLHAASSNYTVASTLNLLSGPLAINGDSLTINTLQRTSGTLTGSAASSVGITGTNAPLFFTSGGRVLKNLFLRTGASADLQTPLEITAGSSAGSVAVGSGATLTTYSFLTLKSDANGTARVAEIPVDGSGNALGSITGDVVIERFIPARRSWRMITAPLSATGDQTINEAWQEGVINTDMTNNQNPNPGFGVHISGSDPSLGFDVTPMNNPSLKVFNRSTSSWSGVANTLTTYVKDYEGYMMFVRGNRSTALSMNTGAPLSTTVIRANGGLRMGRQSITLGSGAGSYTLVGNPYPSTIDFRSLSISGSGSTKTFVMWDPALTGTQGVGAYQYFTQVGGAGTDYAVFPGGGSYGVSGTVNNFVQSGQAFLVQNSGAATLTINESSKAASSTSTVFRPMPDNITGKISTILYRMDADSSMMVVDGGLVIYRSEYDDNIDLDDVKKLSNTNSENFGINKSSVIYQIEKRQSINEEDSIQYSMRNLVARPYHLAIDLTNMEATGMEAYLKDNFTNTLTRMDYSNTNIYPFVPANGAPGSYAADRFKIVFRPMTVLPVTFTALDAYRKQDAINVEWKTANEGNIRNYVVEKSADGINFTKQSGNIATNSSSKYEWQDNQPLQGFNYYRIKSIENNGRSKYSNVVKVLFGKQAASISVFPNPVTDGKINLYFTQQQGGVYTTRLFNNAGQLVHTEKIPQPAGSGNATINTENELPHGNYILEVIKPDSSKEHINIVY